MTCRAGRAASSSKLFQELTAMIITSQVRFTKELPVDQVWQITRSKKNLAPGALWVPELAPSDALFRRYLTEWKGQPGPVWWKQYSEIFLRELQDTMLPKLRELWKLEKAGRNIGLTCFCAEYIYCHRFLIAGFLRTKGLYDIKEWAPPGQAYFAGAT